MFDDLKLQAPDPLLSLIGQYAADPRRDKIDLGVGVYRDDNGRTPVFGAVKAAEQRLVDTQASKAYLGPDGDPAFVDAIAGIALGALPADRAVSGLQTPGGTGALRLAADLIAHTLPKARLWLGLPSWPNHAAIFDLAGVPVQGYPLYDVATQSLMPEKILAALRQAEPGDVVLLHGCCHNPTGADPDLALWSQIIDIVLERGLLPLVDVAYQGLGAGFEQDAEALRLIVSRVPTCLIAYSCDKNFGLYRDRVGALLVVSPQAERSRIVHSHLMNLARGNYSMPPDHGAAVVRTILDDPALRAQWRAELDGMGERVRSVRMQLATYGRIGPVDLGVLAHQRGIFALLPIAPEATEQLRQDHAVYMARSGRVNLAGLVNASIPAFAQALAAAVGDQA